MSVNRLEHIEHPVGRRRTRWFLITSALVLVLAGFIAISVERFAQAKPGATITVNTLADTVANDGACTLREAIQSANAGMPIGGCASGVSGPDTIVITATGTIMLGAALPTLVQSVDIVGPGPESLTLSGNNAVRVISVTTGINVSLSNIALANGNASAENGGAIYNRGTLTLSHGVVFSNTAHIGAGIYNVGALILTDTAVYHNTSPDNVGGGIYNLGTLTITHSTLYSNTATNGGGLYTGQGMATIDSSAIYGNVGGVSGGGIDNNGGTVNIANSTIANNKVTIGGGGGLLNIGTLTVTNSTIAGNSHNNIFNSNVNTIVLRNTLVANAISSENCVGPITVGGNNLQFGGTLANSCGAGLPTADPRLAPLGNYGGSTPTLALGAGSAAIDAGSTAFCPATDQRGVPRPLGVQCDIGAYEFMPTLYLPLVLQ